MSCFLGLTSTEMAQWDSNADRDPNYSTYPLSREEILGNK